MIEVIVVLIALFCLLFAILNLIGSFVVTLADMEVDQVYWDRAFYASVAFIAVMLIGTMLKTM